MLNGPDAGSDNQPSLVVNETGARMLGYKTPQDALGRSVAWTRWSASRGTPPMPPMRSSQIVGVVRDYTLGSIRTPISPTLYFIDVWGVPYVVAQLDGRRLPETLQAIDQVWKRTGHARPIVRTFESQAVQAHYRDVVVQGVVIAVCAGLAILIACRRAGPRRREHPTHR